MTDAETIADLERQVATLQQQLRVENNRRRHLEVKTKILAASFNRVRMEAQDLRTELYGSEALRNEEMGLRNDERIAVRSLKDADASMADMATCVIIGSAETRIIHRPAGTDLVYTPRFISAQIR